nr:triadin isoform X2 [Monopterus albus]
MSTDTESWFWCLLANKSSSSGSSLLAPQHNRRFVSPVSRRAVHSLPPPLQKIHHYSVKNQETETHVHVSDGQGEISVRGVRKGRQWEPGWTSGPRERERESREERLICHLSLPQMSSQTSGQKAIPSARASRRFLDDVILTFSSPMAWLLVVALIITWSAVFIVLFDLLDYKTLTGGVRPIKSSPAGVPGDITHESTDWLAMIWSYVVSLVAPDEEEEGIHQLTETLTSFHSEDL